MSARLQMWDSLSTWQTLVAGWIDGKFNEIDTEDIRGKGDLYTKVVNRCTKKLRQNPVLDELRRLVFEFKDTMPIVVALRNKSLQDYHWAEIRRIVGRPDFSVDAPDFTLRQLLGLNVARFMNEI